MNRWGEVPPSITSGGKTNAERWESSEIPLRRQHLTCFFCGLNAACEREDLVSRWRADSGLVMWIFTHIDFFNVIRTSKLALTPETRLDLHQITLLFSVFSSFSAFVGGCRITYLNKMLSDVLMSLLWISNCLRIFHPDVWNLDEGICLLL